MTIRVLIKRLGGNRLENFTYGAIKLNLAILFLLSFHEPLYASALEPAPFRAPPAGMVIEWIEAGSTKAYPVTILESNGFWVSWQRPNDRVRESFTLFCWECDKSYRFDAGALESMFPLKVGNRTKITRNKDSRSWIEQVEVLGTDRIEVPAGVFDVYIVRISARNLDTKWRGTRTIYFAPTLGWSVRVDTQENNGNSSDLMVSKIDGLTGIVPDTKFDDRELLRLARQNVYDLLPVTASQSSTEIGMVTDIKTRAFGTPPDNNRKPRFVDDRVVSMELLETVPGSALRALFDDDTELRLGSASQARLDRFIYDPNSTGGEMILALGLGAFRFLTGQMEKEGIRVDTKDVIISVRGTDFTVDVIDSETIVTVYQGEVEVLPRTGGGGSSAVGVGQTASISTSGVVSVSTAAPGQVEDHASFGFRNIQSGPSGGGC